MPKKFLHKLSIIVACLIVFIGTIIPTHANNFYGIQPLKPMVEGDKTAIHLLGGVRATVGEQTEYSLTDHLQSTRLAVAGNNFVSMRPEYTPFGDTPANTTTETAEVGQYTGMNYESETATYDYHARAYDGSTARFTSPDAIRESISPYSYTENNPVNFVDPNGLGRVHLFLYSLMYDISTVRRRKDLSSVGVKNDIDSLIKSKRLPVEINYMEDDTKIQLGPGDKVKHLTIRAHGHPMTNSIYLWDTENNQATYLYLNGEDFVPYLYDRLQLKAEGVTKTIESICFISCGAGWSGNLAPSFADDFTNIARRWFPNLEYVYASPHPKMNLTRGLKKESNTLLISSTSGFEDSGDEVSIVSGIKPEKFFKHDFPRGYYKTGHYNSSLRLISVNEGVQEIDLVGDRKSIKSFVSANDLLSQHFRKIPTAFKLPERRGTLARFTPRPKTRSVDIPKI